MKPGSALLLPLAGLGMLAGCGQYAKPESHQDSTKGQAELPLPSLHRLIRFSDPKECEFTEPMNRLLESLIHSNADYTISAGKPAIPPEFAAAFGKPTSTTARDHLLTVTVPVRGTWKGLRVTSVGSSAMPESDYGWDTIRFAAPRQSVMQRLNEAGMALPLSGKRRHADPENPMELSAEVTVDKGETVLGCS